jgi:hypothetical protein
MIRRLSGPGLRRAACLLLAAFGLVLLAVSSGAQCQMCKTALTNSPEGRQMVQSFNYAILMMVAAPYLVVGTVTAALLRRRLLAAASDLAGRLGRRRLSGPGLLRHR